MYIFYFIILFSALFLNLLIAYLLVKRLIKFKIQREYIELQRRKAIEMAALSDEEARQATIVAGYNSRVEFILSHWDILIDGPLGSGKTTLGDFLLTYKNNKILADFKKNERFYKIMKPDYYNSLMNCIRAGNIPVYSNITLTDKSGNKAQDLWPILIKQKKGMMKSAGLQDESGEKLGSGLYYTQTFHRDEVHKAIADFGRYHRQDLEMIMIYIEQSRGNMWKELKDKGQYYVRAAGVDVWLQPKGVKKLKRYKLLNAILPGIVFAKDFVCGFMQQFFIKDKIIYILKSLLSAYFLLPTQFYARNIAKLSKLQDKFNIIKVSYYLPGDDQKHYFLTTNSDYLKVDHFAHKSKYDAQFDANGNRIKGV